MSYVFDQKLSGKVALVTGASRGIGKGIATILVESGATVYITGRENSEGANNVKAVAEQLNEMKKGKCIAIFCDHYNDKDVDDVFETIDKNHDGQLDILVNNAFTGVTALSGDNRKKKFYELEPNFWDKINHVGLRSNYYCGVLAARMMVKREKGLIVNISSAGGLFPLFGVAYGVGKEGNDRMAMEMAVELKDKNVTVISLWPGLVKTETMNIVAEKNKNGLFGKMWHLGEDPTLSGKAIVALASDIGLMNYTGKIVLVAEVANYYGFTDLEDKVPCSILSLKYSVERRMPGYGRFIPSFLRIPGWFVSGYYNKF